MKNTKIDNSINNLLGWLDKVTKAFGQVVTVSDASFEIPRSVIIRFLDSKSADTTGGQR